MKIAVCVVLAAMAALGGAALAQGPTFEVASVKVNASGDLTQDMNTLPGRVVARNMTLSSLIWHAYGVRPAQVDTSGAPGWVGGEHFDIEATFTPPATPEQVSLMLQNLLADRFKLVVRREMRTEGAYSLVFAQANRSFGPALNKARDPQCVPMPGDSGGNGAPPCGRVQFGRGRLAGTSVTWTQLVNGLSAHPAVGGPVANGAGEREGLYDFELRWRPSLPNGASDRGAVTNIDVPDSIFTAVQEQLGLTLNRVDGAPLPVIVVTAAGKPDPN